MNKNKKLALAVLFVYVFMYLQFALVSLQFDFTQWTEPTRFLYVMITFVLSAIVASTNNF
jgi:uncharacterized membrane protein